MTKTPLTPNDVEPRVDVVLGGNIPQPPQRLRTPPRPSRIEILQRCPQKRHALRAIADPTPPSHTALVARRRPLTPPTRFVDERPHGLEEHDVRDEVEEDVCGDAPDPGADVERAEALWARGRRIGGAEWADRRWDVTQFGEEIEEELARSKRIDAR